MTPNAMRRSALLSERASALSEGRPLPVPHARRYVEAWASQDAAAFNNAEDLLQVCQVCCPTSGTGSHTIGVESCI